MNPTIQIKIQGFAPLSGRPFTHIITHEIEMEIEAARLIRRTHLINFYRYDKNIKLTYRYI